MKTSAIGRKAEEAVAEHLRKKGFQIVSLNWRRKLCEIDIVAKKEDVVFLVETKYRNRDNHGDGFEHITTGKIRQMTLAARVWVNENDWGGDYRLLAAAVSGPDFSDIKIIEL